MEVDSLNIKITADVDSAAQSLGNVGNELNKLGDSAGTAGNDVSRLVEEMSAAAANMANVSGNIETSSSGLTGFQSNVDAVSNTLTGLNFKFDYLRDSVQNSYGAFDSAADSVSNLSTASAASADALNSITTATDNFGLRMGELQASTSGTADNMAQLQGALTDALSQLRSFSDSMGNAGNDAETAAKRIAELSKEVKNIPNKQVTDLAAGFKTLKGVVATLGIGKFIKDSNDAYVVQMQNELKLTAHMKQRMNATEDEIKSIKELASAQQKIGVIGDEIQLAGAQQLTTYARQASTLQTLLPAMNNLIAQNAGYEASVGDATSAADMLGRALNGQYTSLKRMGVVFTSAQENVLKYGTETQKAAVLADAINSKVGNMNELLANTPTGQLKQLQNDFGDLQEQIGATFQPLIQSVVPILSQVLTDLKEPILAVSSGIATIGSALTQLDSPFLKFIVYGAVAASIISKLKFAMGGTAAGLLLLGTLLSFVVGRTQEEQETVGDIVSTAMNAATTSTDGATDAAKEYENELGEVQKAATRLAGFDTITKLSGSSQGSLAASLFSDSDKSNLDGVADSLRDAQDEVGGLQDALDNLKMPSFDFSKIVTKVGGIASGIWKLIFGNDDERYNVLVGFTKDIEKIFGKDWVKTWEDVGSDIYGIFSGDDSKIYKGWFDLNEKIKGLFGTDWTDFWQGVGSNIYDIVNGDDSEILRGWRGLRDKVEAIFGKDWTNFWEGVGENISSVINGAQKEESRLGGQFSSAELYYIAKDAIINMQMSVDDAMSYAVSTYINSADAEKWFEDQKTKNALGGFNKDSLSGVWLQDQFNRGVNLEDMGFAEKLLYSNLSQAGFQFITPQTTDRYDVPVNSGADWKNGGVSNQPIYIQAFLDSEEIAAQVVNKQDQYDSVNNYRSK